MSRAINVGNPERLNLFAATGGQVPLPPTEPPQPGRKYTFKRVFSFILNQCMYVALIYFGVYQSVQGAANVLYVMAWLGFVARTICAFAKEPRDKMRAQGRSVPGFIGRSFGMGYVAVLLWHSWWVTGLVLLWNEIMETVVFDSEDKQ